MATNSEILAAAAKNAAEIVRLEAEIERLQGVIDTAISQMESTDVMDAATTLVEARTWKTDA